MKAFLRYWFPLLVWLTLIFVGSTDVLSGEHTSLFMIPFLHRLFPHLLLPALERIELIVRKAGHISEYAILAVLSYRALVNTFLAGRRVFAGVMVLLFCLLYAASDEFHQSFVPSRTASWRDVVIDLCGALFAVFIYSLCARNAVAASPQRR